jgi:hypothetical protein
MGTAGNFASALAFQFRAVAGSEEIKMNSWPKFAGAVAAVGTMMFALSACEPYPPPPPPPGYYGPAPAGNYEPPGYSYYDGAPDPGWNEGYYEDPCDADPGYCGYGYYEGPLWFGGAWYGGPHRWRDGNGGREFYIHGSWHGEARAGHGGHWHGPGHYTRGRP